MAALSSPRARRACGARSRLLFVALAAGLGVSSAQRLATKGRYIVDAVNGSRVSLRCVNWYGLEETGFAPGGLQATTPQAVASLISSFGFNCVRLPVSAELVLNHTEVWAPAVAAYPDLKGKTGLEALDVTVKSLSDARIRVILDLHTLTAGWCCSGSDGQGLWYSANVSTAQWEESLVTLAGRYRSNAFVVGLDLKNELRDTVINGEHLKVSWDDGNEATDWAPAAERAGAKVLAANPDLLIVVGGIDYDGDLSGAAARPVRLPVAGRLVYEAHDYSYWTSRASTPSYDAFKQRMDAKWGFLVERGIAPVWLGEFGTCHDDSCIRDPAKSWSAQWWQYVRQYVSDLDLPWGYWAIDGTQSRAPGRTWNATEGYGILNARWSGPANPNMLSDLQKLV